MSYNNILRYLKEPMIKQTLIAALFTVSCTQAFGSQQLLLEKLLGTSNDVVTPKPGAI